MKMNKILLIETATDVCSVAVADGEKIIFSDRISEPRSQASGLAPLIQKTVAEAGMSTNCLDDVAVSSGPGSYTGLRVGVSTAKGICFGAGIPLIGIGTLDIIAQGAIRSGILKNDPEGTAIIPMIDARRMEVYTAVFDHYGNRITEVEAAVLAPDTFIRQLDTFRRLVFTGDGAAKYDSLIPEQYRDRCIVMPSHPDAVDMAVPAFRALQEKRFEDTAYFEPFYLKEFVAADPSRRIEAVLHGKL